MGLDLTFLEFSTEKKKLKKKRKKGRKSGKTPKEINQIKRK